MFKSFLSAMYFVYRLIYCMINDSSVSNLTGYVQCSATGVQIPAGPGTFFFATVSRQSLGTIQPLIQWVIGLFIRGKGARA
jgi:hypothetical protein